MIKRHEKFSEPFAEQDPTGSPDRASRRRAPANRKFPRGERRRLRCRALPRASKNPGRGDAYVRAAPATQRAYAGHLPPRRPRLRWKIAHATRRRACLACAAKYDRRPASGVTAPSSNGMTAGNRLRQRDDPCGVAFRESPRLAERTALRHGQHRVPRGESHAQGKTSRARQALQRNDDRSPAWVSTSRDETVAGAVYSRKRKAWRPC